MAVQKVVAIMDGVLNLWQSMGGDGCSAAEGMAKDGLQNVSKMIQDQSMLSFQDAASVNTKLTGMLCWSESAKDDLKTMLSSKVTFQPSSLPSDATHCGRRKQQDYTSFPSYCPDWLWELLLDKEVDWEKKIIAVSKLAVQLGMRCPSEMSSAVLMTMSLLDSMSDRGKVEDQSMYDLLQECKRKIKDVSENHAAVHEYVQVLPRIADDFKSSPWYGEAFADGKHPAAMMKVHLGDIMAFARKIPLRTSRSTVQPRSRLLSPGVQDNNAMASMMGMMMQFMQGQQQLQPQQQPPQQRNRAHCSLSAILNGSSRATASAGAGAGDAGGGGPAGAGTLAIEDVEEKEKLALERQKLEKEKSELEKLRKPVVPEPADGLQDVGSSVSEGVRRLKDFMSAGKDKRTASAKEAGAQSEKAKKEKAKKEKVKKENAKKKENVKGNVKTENVKGNVKEDVKKVKKENVKIPARLVKMYPSGCSKCRHKAGCTPSCFRGRGQL